MSVALITCAAGLIGFEAARLFASRGLQGVGIDNDMRAYFFGISASTAGNRQRLEREVSGYIRYAEDIRDREGMARIFARYGAEIAVVIHATAQSSHDWAAREPVTDFEINATGTLNLLELTRRHCADAAFIFTSTNKVYGDTPNRLVYRELETRWEPAEGSPEFDHGIGGGRAANCSMLEAIALVECEARRPLNWSYREPNRTGDHIWWISDLRKFQSHYRDWTLRHGIAEILAELVAAQASRRPPA